MRRRVDVLALFSVLLIAAPTMTSAQNSSPAPSPPSWVPVERPCDIQPHSRDELVQLGQDPDESLMYAQQGPTEGQDDLVELEFPEGPQLGTEDLESIDKFFEGYVMCLNSNEASTYSLMTDGFAGAFIRAETDDTASVADYVDSLFEASTMPSASPDSFDGSTLVYLPYRGWKLSSDQVGVLVGIAIYFSAFEVYPDDSPPAIEDTLLTYVILNRDNGGWLWADLTGPIDPASLPRDVGKSD